MQSARLRLALSWLPPRLDLSSSLRFCCPEFRPSKIKMTTRGRMCATIVVVSRRETTVWVGGEPADPKRQIIQAVSTLQSFCPSCYEDGTRVEDWDARREGISLWH